LLGDAKSSLGGAKSSLSDTKSSLGDSKSLLGDTKSLLGDAKSSLGDAESLLGDTKSSLGGAKSSLGDAESLLGDTKSLLGDTKSLLGDTKSSLGGARAAGAGAHEEIAAETDRVLQDTTRAAVTKLRHALTAAVVRGPGGWGRLSAVPSQAPSVLPSQAPSTASETTWGNIGARSVLPARRLRRLPTWCPRRLRVWWAVPIVVTERQRRVCVSGGGVGVEQSAMQEVDEEPTEAEAFELTASLRRAFWLQVNAHTEGWAIREIQRRDLTRTPVRRPSVREHQIGCSPSLPSELMGGWFR
jgi:hypothetical protein